MFLIYYVFILTRPYLSRRQYAESWSRMVELRAQIQAQLRLADTLRKITQTAGGHVGEKLQKVFKFQWSVAVFKIPDRQG